MDFAFSEEQEELRRVVRSWLEGRSPRALIDSGRSFDRNLWREMASLGWVGIAISEEHGGAGYGFLELVVVLEEMGRALFSSPYLSTAVLGAWVIATAGSSSQQAEWLPPIAAGETMAAVALAEPAAGWEPDTLATSAVRTDGGWSLSGMERHVIDGAEADLLVVAARTDAGPCLFLVPTDAPGVARRRMETLDLTRSLAEVRFDEVFVGESGRMGQEGAAAASIERLVDIAALALAAEGVGGASRCLDMAVGYAKQRVQFGRPIGSFQAIKHKCADMLVEVESARAAAYYAGWAAAEAPEELPLVAPLAKSYCSEAYVRCAAENIQVHGGIGFTWEHDAHLHLRRAKSTQLLFGGAAHHRHLLARRIGLIPTGEE